jgi:hypothetical protein
MENQNNNSKLKGIIGVLALLLVISLVYIFKLTSYAKALETKIVNPITVAINCSFIILFFSLLKVHFNS